RILDDTVLGLVEAHLERLRRKGVFAREEREARRLLAKTDDKAARSARERKRRDLDRQERRLVRAYRHGYLTEPMLQRELEAVKAERAQPDAASHEEQTQATATVEGIALGRRFLQRRAAANPALVRDVVMLFV